MLYEADERQFMCLTFTLFTVQNLFWSWLKLMVWSSQDSSDAIVTKLDDLGFKSKQGPQSFSSLKPPRLTERPHQAFYALDRGSTGDRMAWICGWWHLHLASRWTMSRAVLPQPPPVCLHTMYRDIFTNTFFLSPPSQLHWLLQAFLWKISLPLYQTDLLWMKQPCGPSLLFWALFLDQIL